jgi:hypothetical protein
MFENLQQLKYGKDNPNSQNNQPQENQSKPQKKKVNGKTKKDTQKWNTDEFRSKKSLVVEIKETEPSPNSDSDSENYKRRQIIDAEPTAIVATTTIQPEEPEDPEEGERLFHS